MPWSRALAHGLRKEQQIHKQRMNWVTNSFKLNAKQLWDEIRRIFFPSPDICSDQVISAVTSNTSNPEKCLPSCALCSCLLMDGHVPFSFLITLWEDHWVSSGSRQLLLLLLLWLWLWRQWLLLLLHTCCHYYYVIAVLMLLLIGLLLVVIFMSHC